MWFNPHVCSVKNISEGLHNADTMLRGARRAGGHVRARARRLRTRTAAKQLAEQLALSSADQARMAGRSEQGVSQEPAAAGQLEKSIALAQPEIVVVLRCRRHGPKQVQSRARRRAASRR